jgi:membrane-associated phospholipid phosphatase
VFRALVILCLFAWHAHAEEPTWYEGRQGTKRVVHLSITTAGLLLHPTLGFLEEGVDCRWCGGPNAIDAGVRNAVVWSETEHAARASDLTSYVLAPGLNYGLVLAGTVASPSTAALMDDLIPIAESMIVTQWVTRAIKISAARTRPYAHFVGPRGNEDNLSFPSGHISFPTALAVSAGMIAHVRGYKSEKLIWLGGGAIALASGYLRMAADRHYVTDVLAGAAIGVAAGLTVPLLMSRSNVQLTPTRTGIAVLGAW